MNERVNKRVNEVRTLASKESPQNEDLYLLFAGAIDVLFAAAALSLKLVSPLLWVCFSLDFVSGCSLGSMLLKCVFLMHHWHIPFHLHHSCRKHPSKIFKTQIIGFSPTKRDITITSIHSNPNGNGRKHGIRSSEKPCSVSCRNLSATPRWPRHRKYAK